MTVTTTELSIRGKEGPQDMGPELQSSRKELLRGAKERRGKPGHTCLSWVQELLNLTKSYAWAQPFLFGPKGHLEKSQVLKMDHSRIQQGHRGLCPRGWQTPAATAQPCGRVCTAMWFAWGLGGNWWRPSPSAQKLLGNKKPDRSAAAQTDLRMGQVKKERVRFFAQSHLSMHVKLYIFKKIY